MRSCRDGISWSPPRSAATKAHLMTWEVGTCAGAAELFGASPSTRACSELFGEGTDGSLAPGGCLGRIRLALRRGAPRRLRVFPSPFLLPLLHNVDSRKIAPAMLRHLAQPQRLARSLTTSTRQSASAPATSSSASLADHEAAQPNLWKGTNTNGGVTTNLIEIGRAHV